MSNGRGDSEGAKFVGAVFVLVEENLVSGAENVDDARGDVAVGHDGEKGGEERGWWGRRRWWRKSSWRVCRVR